MISLDRKPTEASRHPPLCEADVTKALGGWIVPVPLVGIVLTGFGIYMMRAELRRLDAVQNQDLQAKELGLPNESSGLTRRVEVYLLILLALELANLVIVFCVWLPILKRRGAPPQIAADSQENYARQYQSGMSYASEGGEGL